MVHAANVGHSDDFVMLRAIDMLGPISHSRVLVVDDYPADADALRFLLEQDAFDVRSACDAGTALAIAQQWLPFAVVVDLAMPDVSGIELGRQLKSNPLTRNMLLVAFTAWDSAFRLHQAREAGFDVYCLKPLAPAHLLAMLRSLTGR